MMEERERFENHMRRFATALVEDKSLDRYPQDGDLMAGDYKSPTIQFCWSLWLAAQQPLEWDLTKRTMALREILKIAQASSLKEMSAIATFAGVALTKDK